MCISARRPTKRISSVSSFMTPKNPGPEQVSVPRCVSASEDGSIGNRYPAPDPRMGASFKWLWFTVSASTDFRCQRLLVTGPREPVVVIFVSAEIEVNGVPAQGTLRSSSPRRAVVCTMWNSGALYVRLFRRKVCRPPCAARAPGGLGRRGGALRVQSLVQQPTHQPLRQQPVACHFHRLCCRECMACESFAHPRKSGWCT